MFIPYIFPSTNLKRAKGGLKSKFLSELVYIYFYGNIILYYCCNNSQYVKMKSFRNLLLFLSIITISGCSSTKLINTWSNKELTPTHYDKIGVAVLFKDRSNRYITERAVVDQLKKRDLKAMPTYDVFPFAGQFKEFTKDKTPEAINKIIVDKINENNFDGFMIITMFDKTQQERWVSDRSFMAGGPGYYGTPYAMAGTYYDYYYYSLGTVYDAGRYVNEVTYYLECNLYDVKSEKLIWRAQSKSVNIQSVSEEAEKLADLIGRQLITKKIITP